MIRRGFHFRLVLMVSAMMVITGCAQVSAPTGGPKDETPPFLIHVDPPSETVNLHPEQLTMEFDEYVVLRDVNQQLVVSPPLQRNPEWRVRGKAVELALDPELFETNRTYVFSFSGAIVDLHESNPVKNLKWAFSTGPELDTMRIEGTVMDRMTRSGQQDLQVMLYQMPAAWDSIWQGRRPDALGQTDEAGHFSIGYLGQSEFVGFALEDENGNYRWDEGEYVALDTTRFTSGDTSLQWLGDATEEAEPIRRIASCRVDSTGMARILAPIPVEVEEGWKALVSGASEPVQFERDGDSVIVWCEAFTAVPIEDVQVVWDCQITSDTAQARPLRGSIGSSFRPLVSPLPKSAPEVLREWKWDRAVFVKNADSLRVFRDSTAIDKAVFSGSEEGTLTRTLTVRLKEEFESDYRIVCLPGGLGFQGQTGDQDTLILQWETYDSNYFGALVVSLTDVPGAGWVRVGRDRLRIDGDTTLRFEQVPPGSLTLGYEWDVNGDSIWQKVVPYNLQSAEPYFYPAEQPHIRSNWLIEWNWSLDTKSTDE